MLPPQRRCTVRKIGDRRGKVEHIVLEAEKDPDALIIMSTHGCSGVGRWVMGSVTDRVLHAVKTPLIIIRTEDNDAVLDGAMGHIIVPLDGSPLAEKILPHAVALAKATEAKLRLVRVLGSPDQRSRYVVPCDSQDRAGR